MLEDSCDWEKVIRKDYEILSFRANTGLLRIKDSNGIFQANGDVKRENTTEQYLLNDGTWSITSVKRLSDGEVFSIGDKILCNEEYIEEIESITIFQENYLSFNFKNTANSFTTESEWSRMQPYKSLLKTEDGVDIFIGDKFYIIDKVRFKVLETKGGHFLNKNWDGCRYKSKENAEEYVLMNKPLLSLNDLLSVWGNNDEFDAYKCSPMFQNFKNLAKTKL